MGDDSVQEKSSSSGAQSARFRAVIDRIEDGDWAVLMLGDDGKTEVDFPRALLPEGASDGDHLRLTVTLDKESRQEAERRIKALQEELEQRSDKKK